MYLTVRDANFQYIYISKTVRDVKLAEAYLKIGQRRVRG